MARAHVFPPMTVASPSGSTGCGLYRRMCIFCASRCVPMRLGSDTCRPRAAWAHVFPAVVGASPRVLFGVPFCGDAILRPVRHCVRRCVWVATHGDSCSSIHIFAVCIGLFVVFRLSRTCFFTSVYKVKEKITKEVTTPTSRKSRVSPELAGKSYQELLLRLTLFPLCLFSTIPACGLVLVHIALMVQATLGELHLPLGLRGLPLLAPLQDPHNIVLVVDESALAVAGGPAWRNHVDDDPSALGFGPAVLPPGAATGPRIRPPRRSMAILRIASPWATKRSSFLVTSSLLAFSRSACAWASGTASMRTISVGVQLGSVPVALSSAAFLTANAFFSVDHRSLRALEFIGKSTACLCSLKISAACSNRLVFFPWGATWALAARMASTAILSCSGLHRHRALLFRFDRLPLVSSPPPLSSSIKPSSSLLASTKSVGPAPRVTWGATLISAPSGRPGWVSAASSSITVSRGRMKRATGDGVWA